jgi:hypothetical protein
VRSVRLGALLLVTFGLVTLAALEGGGVAILTTQGEQGDRGTRTWVARAEGAFWIEAADETGPFLHDLRRDPGAVLRRAGRAYRCRAEVVPNPAGHRRIRGLLRERYGWRDRWVGWLTDTSGSRAIRLDCDGGT